MNLVDHYILEILSTKETTFYGRRMVVVEMKIMCYGVVETVCKIFGKDEWEKILLEGRYLA